MNVVRDGLIIPIKSGSEFQRSAVGVQRKERVGIKIVSRAHVPGIIGKRIGDRGEYLASRRIERKAGPEGATGIVRLDRLARQGWRWVRHELRNGVEAPQLLAGLGVEAHHPTARAKIGRSDAGEHLSIPGYRTRDEGFLLILVGVWIFPELFAGFGVKRDHAPIGGATKEPAIEVGSAAIVRVPGIVGLDDVVDDFVPPQFASLAVDSIGHAPRRDIKRAPDFQNTAAEPGRLVQVDLADLLEAGDILGRNLIQIDIAPTGVIFVDCDPVVGPEG
jgi:hypothetical protein